MNATLPQWDIVDMEHGVYETTAGDVVWRLWRQADQSYRLAPRANLDDAQSIGRLAGLYSVLDVATAYLTARTDLKEKQP